MGVPAPAHASDFLHLSSQLGQGAGYRPYHYGLQQADMQRHADYTQLSAAAQQIAFMGNISALAGLGGRYAPPMPSGWEYGPPKPTYKFMQRTKGGRAMRQIMEMLFWLGIGGLALFIVVIPVAIKLTSALWAWALT